MSVACSLAPHRPEGETAEAGHCVHLPCGPNTATPPSSAPGEEGGAERLAEVKRLLSRPPRPSQLEAGPACPAPRPGPGAQRRAEAWSSERSRPVPPAREGQRGWPSSHSVPALPAARWPLTPTSTWPSRRLPSSAPRAGPGSPRWRRRCKQA